MPKLKIISPGEFRANPKDGGKEDFRMEVKGLHGEIVK